MSTHCECGEKIVKLSDNGDLAIRNRIILVKSNGTFAVCPRCRKEVLISNIELIKIDEHVVLNDSLKK